MTNVINVDFNNRNQVNCEYDAQLDNLVLEGIQRNARLFWRETGEENTKFDFCRRTLVQLDSHDAEEGEAFTDDTKNFEIHFTDERVSKYIKIINLDDLLDFYFQNKKDVLLDIMDQNKQ